MILCILQLVTMRVQDALIPYDIILKKKRDLYTYMWVNWEEKYKQQFTPKHIKINKYLYWFNYLLGCEELQKNFFCSSKKINTVECFSTFFPVFSNSALASPFHQWKKARKNIFMPFSEFFFNFWKGKSFFLFLAFYFFFSTASHASERWTLSK